MKQLTLSTPTNSGHCYFEEWGVKSLPMHEELIEFRQLNKQFSQADLYKSLSGNCDYQPISGADWAWTFEEASFSCDDNNHPEKIAPIDGSQLLTRESGQTKNDRDENTELALLCDEVLVSSPESLQGIESSRSESECNPGSFYDLNSLGDSDSSSTTKRKTEFRQFLVNPIDTDSSREVQPSTSSSLNTKGHLLCPYCRATFRVSEHKKSLHTQQTHLSIHILRNHCQHYFPNQKLATVTEKQYREILGDLLFKDVCIKVMNQIQCPWCAHSCAAGTSRKFRTIHLDRFKLHLVKNHRRKLEKKLWNIQRDPRLSETLQTINPNGFHCECGVYLPSGGRNAIHLKQHCVAVTPTEN